MDHQNRDRLIKYKGVRKRKWGKWVSEIRLPNSRERIWLGSYSAPEKAARAFDVALYCLRGPTATFNFPDDPPDVPGGQWLSPVEIQNVAAQYGNDYRLRPLPANSGGSGNSDHGQGANTQVMELEDMSASPIHCGGVHLEAIDWSFPDSLDGPFAISDNYFGIYHGDVYMPPNIYNEIDNGDGDSGDHFTQQSFLWNF